MALFEVILVSTLACADVYAERDVTATIDPALACGDAFAERDVTAIIDPALPALAEDYAATVLGRPRSDFSYSNISVACNDLLVLLYYFDDGRKKSFNVFINASTWERRHDPQE